MVVQEEHNWQILAEVLINRYESSKFYVHRNQPVLENRHSGLLCGIEALNFTQIISVSKILSSVFPNGYESKISYQISHWENRIIN